MQHTHFYKWKQVRGFFFFLLCPALLLIKSSNNLQKLDYKKNCVAEKNTDAQKDTMTVAITHAAVLGTAVRDNLELRKTRSE